MTDEELAEAYIKKNNLEWELECDRTSPIGEVKQAFLAGLKAGRLKWHKDAAEFGYNKGKSEAKEIIANILTFFPDYKVKTFDDMSLLNALVKAEQFLKEVEE